MDIDQLRKCKCSILRPVIQNPIQNPATVFPVVHWPSAVESSVMSSGFWRGNIHLKKKKGADHIYACVIEYKNVTWVNWSIFRWDEKKEQEREMFKSNTLIQLVHHSPLQFCAFKPVLTHQGSFWHKRFYHNSKENPSRLLSASK